MKRILLVPAFILCAPLAVHANQAGRGWCESGAQLVITSGINSTTQVQASYPSCTVTINIHGGGLATIFSDNVGTPLANPFLAQTGGQWQFYAANGRYDITLSGAGIPSPVTYSDIILYDSTVAQTVQCVVTFSATPVFTANPCSVFSMNLTGNVTSSSVTGAVAGQIIIFSLTQGAGGPWTFVWPGTFLNPPLFSPVAGASEQAAFVFLADGNWHNLYTGESTVFDTGVNGNVLKIAGVRITGLTGSGGLLVLQTSPTLTTPTLNTPTITSPIFSGPVSSSILFANNIPLQWKDDGGVTRNVINTIGSGTVSIFGYHGNALVNGTNGETDLFDDSVAGHLALVATNNPSASPNASTAVSVYTLAAATYTSLPGFDLAIFPPVGHNLVLTGAGGTNFINLLSAGGQIKTNGVWQFINGNQLIGYSDAGITATYSLNGSTGNGTFASLNLNGSQAMSGVQGTTGTNLLASSTVAGAGAFLCTDIHGNATTVGCGAGSFSAVNFTPVTITNSNALNNLQSVTVTANALAQGTLLEVDITGIESTAAGYNLTIGVGLGGGTQCQTFVPTAIGNNQPWNVVAKFMVLTSGVGGTGNWSCEYFSSSSGGGVTGPFGVVGAPTIAINTTIGNILQVTETMSVANPGNSVTEQFLKSIVF